MTSLNSCVPIVTPFNQDLTIDFGSFNRYINHLYLNGIRSIVIGGSTGESLSLTDEERMKIVSHMRSNWPDLSLVGGVAVCDWVGLDKTIGSFAGCKYILVMPQLFIRPQYADLKLFFQKVIERARYHGMQVILYNNPARLGIDIMDMYEELYDRQVILGTKETVFNPNDKSTIPSIPWWCGEDSLAVSGMQSGAIGVISALSNLLPDISVRIANKEQSVADENKWHMWSTKVQEYRNPLAVKYLLHKLGLISSPALRFALSLQDMSSLDTLLEAR